MVLRYSLVAATVWLLSSDLLEFRLLSSKKKKKKEVCLTVMIFLFVVCDCQEKGLTENQI